MARDDLPVLAPGHNRRPEAELPDAVGHGLDGLGVLARVTQPGAEIVDRDPHGGGLT